MEYYVEWLAWNGEENLTCISNHASEETAREFYDNTPVSRDIPQVSLFAEDGRRIAFKEA